jgi:septum formation protein
MTYWQLPVVLASASPRRASLLMEANIDSVVVPPACDDGVYQCGTMDVRKWVETLAVMKAEDVRKQNKTKSGTILAADTVCEVDNQIYGQPRESADARKMLQSMLNKSHFVYTGWCLLSQDGLTIRSGCERVEITIGTIDTEEIENYIKSEQWMGKAGAYNLCERIAVGWPINCDGDRTSVMGLPMERLKQELCNMDNSR